MDESRFLVAVQFLRPYSIVRPRDQILERMKALGVRLEDLEESFSRSGGPGGQHVNKTASAVEITHRPTGTVATASDSRSQHMNRSLALLRLVEKLEQQRADIAHERRAAAAKIRRQKSRRSRSTKREMVENKRRRGETKKLRRRVDE